MSEHEETGVTALEAACFNTVAMLEALASALETADKLEVLAAQKALELLERSDLKDLPKPIDWGFLQDIVEIHPEQLPFWKIAAIFGIKPVRIVYKESRYKKALLEIFPEESLFERVNIYSAEWEKLEETETGRQVSSSSYYLLVSGGVQVGSTGNPQAYFLYDPELISPDTSE